MKEKDNKRIVIIGPSGTGKQLSPEQMEKVMVILKEQTHEKQKIKEEITNLDLTVLSSILDPSQQQANHKPEMGKYKSQNKQTKLKVKTQNKNAGRHF